MGSLSIWHWLVAAAVIATVLLARRRVGAVAAAPADGLASNWALALPRGAANSYSRAETLRDTIARRFEAARPAGLSLVRYESPRGSGAVWLRLEAVRADADAPDLTLRTVIAITIERLDFHRFEQLVTVEVGRGGVRRSYDHLLELRDADIATLLAYAAGERASLPRLTSPRARTWGGQFWRPRNRITRVRTDWLDALGLAGGLSLLAMGVSTIVEGGASLEACEYDDVCGAGTGAWLLLAGTLALVARFAWARRRQVFVLNAGKPVADPRALVRMDSWQATLRGLGERRDAVLAAVLEALASRQPPGVVLQSELIGYASADGKVEREQQVASFRRALAFLRLESYGRDLYVGWDSHINAATWIEQDVARGIDRVSGLPVVARRVVEGWQAPSEYDVGDCSYLTEWLHAGVVAVIKDQLAQHRIDQEIDFTIQRESRSDALRTRDPGAKSNKAFGAGLLRRTG